MARLNTTLIGSVREQPHLVLEPKKHLSRETALRAKPGPPARPLRAGVEEGRPVRGHPQTRLPKRITTDGRRASGLGGRRDAEHADTLRSRKARPAIPHGDFRDCDPRRPTERQAHLRARHLSHTRIP
jgi:hypothetical protein